MNPFKRKAEASPSRDLHHRKHPKPSPQYSSELTSIRRDYQLPSPTASPDFVVQINELDESLRETLRQVLPTFSNLWSQLTLEVLFQKDHDVSQHFWLVLPKQYINQEQDVDGAIRQMLQDAKDRIEKQELRGSGWRFANVERVELTVSKYRPLQGSSYIPTPKDLAKKVCLINVQNDDEACFKWAVLSAMFPVSYHDHPQRVSKYEPYQDRLKLEGIPLPVALDKRNFEKILHHNPELHLNVFLWDPKEGVLPFFMDPHNPQQAIDLLFLPHPNHASGHYVWIKNFSRLVAGSISKSDKKTIPAAVALATI